MQNPPKPPKPVLLCILDGWGYREDANDNALRNASTPHYDRFWRTEPHAFLKTSGAAVGLPDEQMGNSEVGHMNLGGGRVVLQDLPRINQAFAEGELERNDAFTALADKLAKGGGVCHLIGLMSPGGVHSHQDHFVALAKALNKRGIGVVVHAILDGRDTPPKSASGYIQRFQKDVADLNAVIATVSGRYFAMDRDKRWDRTEKAYAAIVEADAPVSETAEAAISDAYNAGQTDEFVSPHVIDGYRGMADGDGLIMVNFRADRARQILTALVDPDFDEFERRQTVDFAAATGMVEYSSELNAFLPALFPPEAVKNNLGEVVSGAGLRQLRIAETEKYAHVTFFFNGGQETAFDGEERVLVPSPKVATYDLKPEMSAPEVTDKLVDAIGSGTFDLIVANFANPDMVGHTGDMEAAIKAVEAVDACLGRVGEAVEAAGGVMLLTADHGNVELMRDQKTGQPHTAHTTVDVPLLLVNSGVLDGVDLENGCLADVAPTILEIMEIEQPTEMTGRSLLKRDEAGRDGSVRAARALA